MSQENVELTLRALDAWNRRDVEAWIALWDPGGVWHPALEGIAEGRTYRGHAEIRQEFEDQAEFSEEAHAEFSEVRDLGDQVLGLGHFRMRFASGVELDQESAVLCTWRNGKCVEARAWLSHADALEAAGLRAGERRGVAPGARALAASNYSSEVFATAAFDPQLEWDFSAHPLPDWPNTGSGRDDFQRQLAEYVSGWREYRAEVRELIDAGDEVVVVLHETVAVRESDAILDRDLHCVWTIRDGVVVRLQVFKTRADAREAAGLRE